MYLKSSQLAAILAAFSLIVVSNSAIAQSSAAIVATNVVSIHQFSGADGANPNSGLIYGADHSLYGITYSGGANGAGVLFKLSPDGSETVLHAFGAAGDGAHPSGHVAIASDGTIYGTTIAGGSQSAGTLYTVSSKSGYSVLYSFGSADVGAAPYGGVTLASDGKLYGATFSGGAGGAGTIYASTTSGAVSALHSFAALDSGGANSDGAFVYGGMVEGADHALYGAAAFGGASGAGAIFRIDSSGSFSTLHSFAAVNSHSEGANPYAGLTAASNGDLYGTTYGGGASGAGTVFHVSTSGTFSTLYSFSARDANGLNTDGANPSSPVTEGIDGRLYGSAGFGGANGSGTVFAVSTDGVYSSVYQFPALKADLSGTAAARPYGGVVQLPSGALYASGYYGGPAATGAVVCFNLPAAPAATGANPGDVLVGKTASITVTGAGFTAGASAQWNGSDVAAAMVTSNQLALTVPSGLITKTGSAQVSIVNSVGSGRSAVAVRVVEHIFDQGLQMFSVPYDYTGTTLDSILSQTKTKLAIWQPGQTAYAVTPNAPAETLHQGNAYWGRFPANISLLTAGGSLTGSKTPFSIPVKAGWNMIGDPFNAAVSLTSLTVIDAQGASHTWSDAAAKGLITPVLYSYSAGSTGYTQLSSGNMVPYAGYWFKSNQAVTLSVPAP